MRVREKIMDKELTLLDYLSFYRGNCVDNLTISQLKQILSIHGFMQLGNSCKEYLVDAVRSLQITPPVRCTTTTNFIPLISLHAASLSVPEITRDMQDIGWEEFPFQSVKTLEPKVPAMVMSLSFMEQIPQTSDKSKENDQDVPLICSLPSLKISKKGRTVGKKHADNYSWRFSGFVNTGLPYKRRYYKCCNGGCNARKYIDHNANDPSGLIATYKGEHNYHPPA